MQIAIRLALGGFSSLMLCGMDVAPVLHTINSPLPEYGMVRGPDGYYFTRKNAPFGKPGKEQIYRIDQQGNLSQPEWASLDHSESDPYFFGDGRWVYFVSDRSGNPDIWRARTSRRGLETPTRMPEPINSSGNEFSPIVASDGSIYFSSDRQGGVGLGDLYRATLTSSHEAWTVENLGPTLNSPGGEWNLDISPDGQTLIFEASHRETNVSVSGDLYMSRKTDGGWGKPVPLTHLNTEGSDLMPRFFSNNEFIYASGGPADVDLHYARID